jgi:hypothetical protein
MTTKTDTISVLSIYTAFYLTGLPLNSTPLSERSLLPLKKYIFLNVTLETGKVE